MPCSAFSDGLAAVLVNFVFHSETDLYSFVLFLLFYFSNCYTSVDNLCRASTEN